MSKRLFLLRHALAIPQSGGGDIKRALSPKGKEDAAALGELMLNQNYLPDIILCSPAVRTRQTLEGLQQHIATPNLTSPKILYNGSAGDYLHEIQKTSDEHKNILIIAHNPSIYELVILLVMQEDNSQMQRLSEGYEPATLSVISCKCDKWADIKPAENELAYITDPMDYNAPARPTRWM